MKKHPIDGAHRRARALRHEMTEAEKKVWQILRSRGMDGRKFRRQVPIGRYIADFVCHKARLITELDGGRHDPASREEIERSEFLQREGYRILRFWNNDALANTEGVYRAILEVLRQHHPHPIPLPSREKA